ncbi:uncharacterized protein LOC129591165 isoform X2 [Paramacrobiotus metropolitanus]|uniref:uncharacterized protein LOC129591165 isoform X2 n=1 Tax=Paramacrobiotus metropolitanus TaxID=2943436 RepID=UPI00244635D1|nr:uncharacterized protein LOC129591165 isoform X2 [Paramacrobiotus metropolitanus]
MEGVIIDIVPGQRSLSSPVLDANASAAADHDSPISVSDSESSGRSDSSLSVGAGGSSALDDDENLLRDFHKDTEGKVLVRMEVSSCEHIGLIGSQGEHVRKLKRDTSCTVHFPATNSPNDATSANYSRLQASHSNEVSIRGKLANAVEALQKLRDAIPFKFTYHVTKQSLLDHPELANGDSVFDQIRRVFPIDISFELADFGRNGALIHVRGPQNARTLLGAKSIVDYFARSAQRNEVEESVTATLYIHPHSQSAMYSLCDAEALISQISKVTRVSITFPNPRQESGDKQKVKIRGSVKGTAAAWLMLMSILPVTVRLFVDCSNVNVRGVTDFLQNRLQVNVLTANGALRGERQYIELKSVEDNLTNICVAYGYILTRTMQLPRFHVRRLADKFQELQIGEMFSVLGQIPLSMPMLPSPGIPFMPMMPYQALPMPFVPGYGWPFPLSGPVPVPAALPAPYPDSSVGLRTAEQSSKVTTGEIPSLGHGVKNPLRSGHAKAHNSRRHDDESTASFGINDHGHARGNSGSLLNVDLKMRYEDVLLNLYEEDSSPPRFNAGRNGSTAALWNSGDMSSISSIWKEPDSSSRTNLPAKTTVGMSKSNSFANVYFCTERNYLEVGDRHQPLSEGYGREASLARNGPNRRFSRNRGPPHRSGPSDAHTDWGLWNHNGSPQYRRAEKPSNPEPIHNFQIGHWKPV